MRVLIVEDGTAAYESLLEILRVIDPEIIVVENTESVGQTVKWLKGNPSPDIILMDIHLYDSSAFLIFDHIEVQAPIIFTTAYDEYAIDAFKVNCIDYLLKPIKNSDLERALTKFSLLSPIDITTYLSKITNLSPDSKYRDKILIPVKDQLLPIDLRLVSYFYTTEKSTQLYLSDGSNYLLGIDILPVFQSINMSNTSVQMQQKMPFLVDEFDIQLLTKKYMAGIKEIIVIGD